MKAIIFASYTMIISTYNCYWNKLPKDSGDRKLYTQAIFHAISIWDHISVNDYITEHRSPNEHLNWSNDEFSVGQTIGNRTTLQKISRTFPAKPAANRVMKKCFFHMVLIKYKHVFRPYLGHVSTL